MENTKDTESTERRREARLRYHWPIWFGSDFKGILNQGQMVDITSKGAAFTCYTDNCPNNGQSITARFSVPRYEEDESFDIENYVRSGQICRIEQISPFLKKVAVQFSDALPFSPGQQKTKAAEYATC